MSPSTVPAPSTDTSHCLPPEEGENERIHRILVVDDDPISAKLLEFLFRDAGLVVTAVSGAAAALAALSTARYDLVILDVMMPGMSGLDLCQAIRKKSGTPVIFVSACGGIKDKVAGLDAGGDDYVIKPYEPNELLARARVLLRRHGRMRSRGTHIIRTAALMLDTVQHTVMLTQTGKTVDLTPMETRLLQFLVSHGGGIVTRDTLVAEVWGSDYHGTRSSLDVFIQRLRTKIEEVPGAPQLLLTVRGVGYKLSHGHRTATGEPDGPHSEGLRDLTEQVEAAQEHQPSPARRKAKHAPPDGRRCASVRS